MWGHAATGTVTALVVAGIGLLRPAEQELWFIVALVVLIDSLGWAFVTRWVGFVGWNRVGALRLASQSLSAVLGITAVFAGLGIAGVFWANLLATTVLLLCLVARVPGPRPARGPLPPGLLASWASFVALEVITQVVGRRIEFLFLGALSTTAELAMYSVPFTAVTVATSVPNIIFGSAIPAVARRVAEAGMSVVADQVGRAIRVVLALSLLLTGALAGLGPLVVLLTFGPEFRTASALLPLLAVTALVTPVGLLCQALWVGAGRLRPVLLIGAVGGVVDIGLAAALIPGLGALGAVIATVSGQLIIGITLCSYTWRRAGRFPFGVRYLATAAATAALVATGTRVLTAAVPTWAGLGLGLLVAAAIVSLAGSRLGFAGPADTRWLAASLPGPLSRATRLFGPVGELERAA
jgi:O-antigen/teichoic acid export membrane protein